MAAYRPSLYVETSVVSYLAARPSRDLLARSRQDITRNWWDKHVGQFDIFVSETVIVEATRGDEDTSRKRLELLAPFPVLPLNQDVEETARLYLAQRIVPESSPGDALHLAFASTYEMDFLVTWNFRHLANAFVRRHLADLNREEFLAVPVICTPEELLGE